MVKAVRINLQGNITYQDVTIYSTFLGGPMPPPNFLEDSQLVFTCKHGKFMIPDYNVILVQMHTRKIRPPKDSYKVKRILLSYDLNYQDCYIIRQEDYAKLGIPQIFREFEQLAFVCKDGLFISTDTQIQTIHLYD